MSETTESTTTATTEEVATETNRVGALHQAHADWLLANKGVVVTPEQVFAIYSTRKAFRDSDAYRKDLVGAKQAEAERLAAEKAAAKEAKEQERAKAAAAKKAEREAAAAERAKATEAKKAEKEAAAAKRAEEKAAKEAEAKAKAEAAAKTESADAPKESKKGKAAKPTAEDATKASDAPF